MKSTKDYPDLDQNGCIEATTRTFHWQFLQYKRIAALIQAMYCKKHNIEGAIFYLNMFKNYGEMHMEIMWGEDLAMSKDIHFPQDWIFFKVGTLMPSIEELVHKLK